MKKMLLTGATGTLGKEILRTNTQYEILAPGSHEMNLRDPKSIELYTDQHQPEIILHCAALTKPMSIHQQNPALSLQTNILGTSYLALAAIKHHSKFIYISTDYVYPGQTGNYKESDPLLPINHYAWSKLGGECAAQLVPDSLILRVAFLARPFLHPKAFHDAYKSNLYHDQIAPLLLEVIAQNPSGILNIGGPRQSLYEFAKQSLPQVEAISKNQSPHPTPEDTSMCLEKLNKILSQAPQKEK